MATSHPAIITGESDEKVANPASILPREAGPVSTFNQQVGTPELKTEERADPWVDLMDSMDQVPRDQNWFDFLQTMEERPLNQPPQGGDLFPAKAS